MIKYRTKEAISYLQRRWEPEGIHVSADTFYHAVSRSHRSFERVKAGKSHRLQFTEDDLNSFVFYGPSHNAYKPVYDPIEVTSTEDLDILRERYGSLVNEEGLIKLLLERYGVEYNIRTLRQRLYRKGLAYAGYSRIGKRKVFWYPTEQLKRARFFPHLVKKD